MIVLFFCTGNTCRSPLVEAVANDALNGVDVDCVSAGTHASPGQRASNGSIVVGEQHALDLSQHKSQLLTYDLLEKVDRVVGVTKSHLWTFRRQFPQFCGKLGLLGLPGKQITKLSEMSGGQDIADPWQGSIESYNKMADYVIEYTNQWTEYFKMEITK